MELINKAAKAHYLDASALIKLILDCQDEEPGRKELRNYFNSESKPFFTTSICFAETIGILKKKQKKIISEDEYIQAFKKLMIMVFGNAIKRDDMNIAKPDIFNQAKKIVESYKLDFADALQIVTLKSGMFSHMCGESQSIFITADNNLAKACINENIRVWNCVKTPKPE